MARGSIPAPGLSSALAEVSLASAEDRPGAGILPRAMAPLPLPRPRRAFLATAAGAVAAAALGDGFLVEPTALEVTHHDLPVPGLAPALAGLRLACVADVHLHRGVPAPARA